MAAKSLIEAPSAGGAQPALEAADVAGDSFPLQGSLTILARNAGAAPVNVTVVAQSPCNHGFEHDKIYEVPNDSAVHWIRIPAREIERFRDANGKIQLTYSNVTSVTVAAHG